MTSIRRRTMVTVLLVFAVTTGAIAVASYYDATHEVEELFDAQLAQQARLLLGILREPLAQQDRAAMLESASDALAQAADQRVAGHPYESKIAFQVWQHGELVLSSDSAPSERLMEPSAGYGDSQIAGFRWRVFTDTDRQTGVEVLVGERGDVRGELVERIVLQTLVPDILGLPLLAGLLWWAIGWGLRPLSTMAEEISARDSHQLSPLKEVELPTELSALARMLNHLLADIESLRSREKRFIADAAHELRTPLAVLDLHAQNAVNAKSESDRAESLARLREGVARASRLVSQLLTLARLNPDAGDQPRRVAVDVPHEVREALAELAPLAAQQGVRLQLEVGESSAWRRLLEPATMDTLVKNLVSNAIYHSPKGATVLVELGMERERVYLCVCDEGEGIPDNLKAAMTLRFRRAGRNAGAGLGLSIVERLAQRHDGMLDLADRPEGGLAAKVTLVAPPS